MTEEYQRELERRAAAAKPMKSTADIIAEMMRNGELDFLEATKPESNTLTLTAKKQGR